MPIKVLIDGRPAQLRPRGMGIYVTRLVRAILDIENELSGDVEIVIALDQNHGDDPWEDLIKLQKIWGSSKNTHHWEQQVLPQLAVRVNADLLHCVANSGPKKSKVPMIVTIHDAIFLRPLIESVEKLTWHSILGYYYYRWTIPQIAKKAKRIITVSKASAHDLQLKLNIKADKIKVIYNASPYKSNPVPEAKIEKLLNELKLSKPYVVAFGAIDLRKNVENLIRAFARLPRSAVETLVLLGFEKVDQTSIPDLIHLLGINDRVRLMSYLSEEDLGAVLQAAAVFAYPSKSEGFGLPILHAFNLGVPVVTTKAGALPEVAGDAVRYADPDDIQSITQELLGILIDSNEAHRLALAGYRQSKNFSWEATATSGSSK